MGPNCFPVRTEGENPQNYFNALMMELTVKTEKLKQLPQFGGYICLRHRLSVDFQCVCAIL